MKIADYNALKSRCGVLWGRCNGRLAEGQPPRPGIVAAMKRPIPSDAHLCMTCKLREREPGADGDCIECIFEFTPIGIGDEWQLEKMAEQIREFHGPWQGGLGDD